MKDLFPIANDAAVLAEPPNGHLEFGKVYAVANESRFGATYLSEPLTAYAVGWTDPDDLQGLLDFIAPALPVSRRFEFKQGENAEYFLSEVDDARAIGAAFKRVDYSGSTVQAKTLNKGLTTRVDHDNVLTDGWQQRKVQMLLQRLRRNEVRRAVTALVAACTNSAVTWGADSQPDADIRNMLKAGADASGMRPNRLLFNDAAWDLRSDRYETQNNAGAYRRAAMTPEQLAASLQVSSVRVSEARYQATVTAKQKIVTPLTVFGFYGQNVIDEEDPSTLKRFYTPTDAGMYRVYEREYEKYTDITVEHYSNVVATSTLGARRLTVSAS